MRTMFRFVRFLNQKEKNRSFLSIYSAQPFQPDQFNVKIGKVAPELRLGVHTESIIVMDRLEGPSLSTLGETILYSLSNGETPK